MKLLTNFLLLVSIMLFSYGCGDSLSKEDAEKQLRSYYEHSDNKGKYSLELRNRTYFIKSNRIMVPENYIKKLEFDNCLAYEKQEYEFYEKNNEYEKTSLYKGNSNNCGGCSGLVGLVKESTKAAFIEVPIKEYFLGINKTWKDKRDLYKDIRWASYNFIHSIEEQCVSLFTGVKNLEKFIKENSINQTLESSEAFQMDSQGDFHLTSNVPYN